MTCVACLGLMAPQLWHVQAIWRGAGPFDLVTQYSIIPGDNQGRLDLSRQLLDRPGLAHVQLVPASDHGDGPPLWLWP